MDKDKDKDDKPLAKESTRSGAPNATVERVGIHSAGVAAGAVGGAVAGAASGLAAGPLGSLVGAAAGAIAGAAAGAPGRGVDIDVTPHLGWWREHWASRPYAGQRDYAALEPAYRYGTLEYLRSDRPREWDEVENELHGGWAQARGDSQMSWDEARPAVRDAWERLHDPERFR